MDDEGTGPEDERPRIVVPRDKQAAVWANHVDVSHSEHGFTLDFAQLETPPRRGILAVRVAASASCILRLLETLDAEWQRYAEKTMPKEVWGDEPEGPEGSEEPGI